MIFYLTFILLFLCGHSKLIPPSINYLGCGNNFEINLTNRNQCNRIIKGTGLPDSTISIYSTHYLEKTSLAFKYPNVYYNLGSVQSGTFDPPADSPDDYPDYWAKIVNGSLETNEWIFDKYQEFVESDLIEMYVVNGGCFVVVSNNGDFFSIGGPNATTQSGVCCQTPPTYIPITQVKTSQYSFITLNSNGTSLITGCPDQIIANNTKRIFAGGYNQYAVLTDTNKLIVLPNGYLDDVHKTVYDNVDPRFVIFNEQGGGCFLDPSGKLIKWGDESNDLETNDIPQVLIEGIKVDQYGNWGYEFTNQDFNSMIYQDAQHLIIQSFTNNEYSGMVSYPDIILLSNNINYSIPSVQFETEPNGYISGVSIPNSQLSLYSIGQKDFEYFGPVQYGCGIGACAQIVNGAVITSGDPKLGGDSSSVASFISNGIVELYVVYSGAFVAIKQSGELITWGSYSFGGGKYIKNAVQIVTNSKGFIVLLSNGDININGDSTDIYDESSQFYQVYAGGTNIFAGLTLTNKLYIWSNGEQQIYHIEPIEGISFVPILTDWVCGIIYDNGEIITFSESNNYIDETNIPQFITRDIYSDSNGNFKYLMTKEQINKFDSYHSSYLILNSKTEFMVSSMSYSNKITWSSTSAPTSAPTNYPTIVPSNSPTLNPTMQTPKPTKRKRPCDGLDGSC